MTQFGVQSDDLRQALKAITPFVPRPSAQGDEGQEQDGVVLAHMTNAETVLLSARGPAGAAVVALPIKAWDGELTDFALHVADLPMLVATFRRSERTLTVTVRHTPYTVPADTANGHPKAMRSTSLTVEEEGSLFGGAEVAFAGPDARAVEVSELWGHLGLTAGGVHSTPMTRVPGKVLAMTSAAERAYGADTVYAVAEDRSIVAMVGTQFLAAFWADSDQDWRAERERLSAWHRGLEQMILQAPHHKIYVDEELPE